MDTLNKVTGSFNAIISIVISVFMIASCILKHRMTAFVWLWLSLTLYCTLTVGIAQIALSNLQTPNCGYVLKTIYSIEVTVLFNLSMLIGYKINCTCREINMFVLQGNLPTESFKRRKHIIMGLIWSASVLYLVILLFFEAYWHFNK